MTILLCPDSFKGTLTAREAAEAMVRGVRSAWPDAKTILMPLADGGEGTLACTLLATGGERRVQRVEGPDGERVEADWGILPDGTAVMEMARASGLGLVRPGANDLRSATSHGTGRLIRAAMEAGCVDIIVGLGGSATNDGGMGAMRALGAGFYDAAGNELDRGGVALARLHRIDLSGFPDVSCLRVIAATDVDNPLCGPDGATRTFAPQKGGTPADIEELEVAMEHYAAVLEEAFGDHVAESESCANHEGAGAAGGLGAALFAFLKAERRSGADVVMDHCGFDAAVERADMILTGEGRLDKQTAYGKAIEGVRRRAQGKPVLAVCGEVRLPRHWHDMNLDAVWGLVNHKETASMAFTHPALAVERATAQMLLEYRQRRP